MIQVATLYYPDLNPIGTPSVFALCLCLFILAALRFSRRRSPVAGSILVATAPLVLIVLAYCHYSSSRRFADADDYAAAIVLLVFAFAFALESFRLDGLVHRALGAVCTLACGGLLSFASGEWLHVLYACRFRRWDERPWWGFGALALFVLVWLPVLTVLNRRSLRCARQAAGLCPQCAYDLRGNTSGVCPECGAPASPSEEQGPWA